MNFPSIRIEGSIVSPELFDRLDELHGQRPADFGLSGSATVKDEIARAWADAQDYWRIFHRKLETIPANASGTTETRNLWIVPLLGLLGYQLEYQQRGPELNAKAYPISHRAANRANTPVHITGYRDPAGLDRKPERVAGPRMSAHALVQEYLNLSDQLYAVVTNGRLLRLLRDSSRLVKLTYLEFDLDRIFTDGLFADFAVLYRFLHASRLPVAADAAPESLIERYHQDSVESGARIRDGLSRAVETAIRAFANGLLAHPKNDALRASIQSGSLKADFFYQHLLRLIYRLLFLLVIEERNLVYPLSPSAAKRDLYYRYYSLQRLRRLAEKRHLADARRDDAWLALIACFRLFEDGGPGPKLGIAPLAGDLFRSDAIGQIRECQLDNATVLGCLRALSLYQNPDTGQTIRVNYAALNVEEFGSVYEGLLKYEPSFLKLSQHVEFHLAASGDDTQSHYTPDDLVQPLLKHSLDHLIAEKLQEKNKDAALLSLRVADISCGSGHILLAAARHIATELAIVRTGEEQPSPTAFRAAIRDVIRECIYGVDLNPLAVELCKVALWLEAHSPGEPLNFLDHHIKCGNAIVGFVRREELERGVPEEAFVALPGDDKDIGAYFRRKNKDERAAKTQATLNLSPELQAQLDAILSRWREISGLPERNPSEIETKKHRYEAFTRSPDAWLLKQIADIPIAQFYLSKTAVDKALIITDEEFRAYLIGHRHPQGQATAAAWALAERKRFFHWFLEFPEIVARGGFDCLAGNPPYLGGKKISGRFGDAVLNILKHYFPKSDGGVDLVSYFVRRASALLSPQGYMAFISTKKICQGDTRLAGLEYLIAHGTRIHFAKRSVRWSGEAADVQVSLFAMTRSLAPRGAILDGKEVASISSFLDDSALSMSAFPLSANSDLSFQGVVPLGPGFYIDATRAKYLLEKNPANAEVLKIIVNGNTLNSTPDLRGNQWIISFFARTEEQAKAYGDCYEIARSTVFQIRQKQKRKHLRERWWQYAEKRPLLYSKIANNQRVLVRTQASKHNVFEFLDNGLEYDQKLIVFSLEDFESYAVLNSDIHFAWILKFSGEVGGVTINYSPTQLFETFPLPFASGSRGNAELASVGSRYTEHRRALMHRLWLGLTDIYNLFHDRDLTPAKVARVSKKPNEAEAGYADIVQLRTLHRELDEAVLAAYGWSGQVVLAHDFQEVETLPENDRVRYIISPAARKEILRRLLALNHERAAEEKTVAAKALKKTAKRAKRADVTPDDLFAHAGVGATGASNWMDQPFVLRNPSRTTFAGGDEYRAALVPELLRQLSNVASFDRFHKAYWLLTRPDELVRVAAKHVQGPVGDWRKKFPGLLRGEDFLPELKGQVTLQRVRLYRGKEDVRTIELLATDVPRFDDVEEDARLAILVADMWPSTEEQVPTFTAPEELQLAKWEIQI